MNKRIPFQLISKNTRWDSEKKEINKGMDGYSQDFFPLIGEDIDFDKGYEFLNKELEKIVRGAKTVKRHADLLIKAYLW